MFLYSFIDVIDFIDSELFLNNLFFKNNLLKNNSEFVPLNLKKIVYKISSKSLKSYNSKNFEIFNSNYFYNNIFKFKFNFLKKKNELLFSSNNVFNENTKNLRFLYEESKFKGLLATINQSFIFFKYYEHVIKEYDNLNILFNDKYLLKLEKVIKKGIFVKKNLANEDLNLIDDLIFFSIYGFSQKSDLGVQDLLYGDAKEIEYPNKLEITKKDNDFLAIEEENLENYKVNFNKKNEEKIFDNSDGSFNFRLPQQDRFIFDFFKKYKRQDNSLFYFDKFFFFHKKTKKIFVKYSYIYNYIYFFLFFFKILFFFNLKKEKKKNIIVKNKFTALNFIFSNFSFFIVFFDILKKTSFIFFKKKKFLNFKFFEYFFFDFLSIFFFYIFFLEIYIFL